LRCGRRSLDIVCSISQNIQTNAVPRPITTIKNINVNAGAVSMFDIPDAMRTAYWQRNQAAVPVGKHRGGISSRRDHASKCTTPFMRRDPRGSGVKSRTTSRKWLGLFRALPCERKPAGNRSQHPRQILLILRSTSLFSSLISASPLHCGPVTVEPVDLAEPVVTPLPVLTPAPDDCAVPAVLVPGAGGDARLDWFAAPLGSSPALLIPPGAAGPGGTPLIPCEPAPAEPGLGEPAALPLLLPADDPPALCANEATGDIRIVIAATAAAADTSFMGNLLFEATTAPRPLFLPERFPIQIIHSHPLDARR
jgi:hypothetical protein